MKVIKINFIILLGITFMAAQSRALEIGVAPATRKILPNAEFEPADTIELFAARGEWEAFQIIIRPETDAPGISASLLSFTGKEGASLNPQVNIYWEYYLDVVNPSSGALEFHPRDAGYYPDPLIPLTDPYSEGVVPVGSFDIEAGKTGVLFVDIFVPTDAEPGAYDGEVKLTIGSTSTVVKIKLAVWDFNIPEERTIGTSFGFSENLPRRYHCGESGAAGEQECEEEVVYRYQLSMHEHRIDPTRIVGPVEFKFDDAGELLEIDWTAYDEKVGPWLDGTKFGDGIPVARFDVSYFAPGRGLRSMTEDQFARAAAAFAEHLEAKGWWEKAWVYATDEPWLNGGDAECDQIKTEIALLNRYTDLWKNKTLITGPLYDDLADDVGIWCPVTPMYEEWLYPSNVAGRDDYAPHLASGRELWFYVCNANFPPHAGYDIDTIYGYEPRIVKWGSWFEYATGFLFWRVNYWVEDDPWNIYLNVDEFTDIGARNGDGFLFYPGDHNGTAGGKGSPDRISIDGPIVSYRLKQIRDGLEDWEMFKIGADLGAEEYVRSQVNLAHKRFGDLPIASCSRDGAYCADDQPWTLDENVLLAARKNIAEKIQFLKNPDKYYDPENPVTPKPKKKSDDDEGGWGCAQGGPGGLAGMLALAPILAALFLRRRKRANRAA